MKRAISYLCNCRYILNHLFILAIISATLIACKSDSTLNQSIKQNMEESKQVVETQLIEASSEEGTSVSVVAARKVSGPVSKENPIITPIDFTLKAPTGSALNLIPLGPIEGSSCSLAEQPQIHHKIEGEEASITRAQLKLSQEEDCNFLFEIHSSQTFQEPIPDHFVLEGDLSKVQVSLLIPFEN